jgi:hypothetical protein
MTVNVNDPTASGMILTFDDEFDTNSTSSDNAADGTLWSNHLWYDSPDPGAISVANGVLSLASGGELSSVDSAGNGFSQTYGYFEIDMKVPSGVGTWPAFWLMSQQHVVSASAPAAEIDIMEGQGNQPNGYYTTLHSDTGSATDQVNPMPNFTGDVSATPLSDGYARFGVLWTPGSDVITYYFNGVAVGTSTEYATTNSSPMMVLIDNWLGDIGWGGNTPTAGQSYGALDIDYVRVYQFASQDPTAVAAQAVSPAAGQTDPTALANADGVGLAAAGSPVSANGTVVAGTNGDIVTAAGNTFAIDAGGQITENGTAIAITNSVSELAYVSGTLYQEATSQNLWWSFNEATNAWTQTSDPLSGSSSTSASGSSSPDPTPSPNGTVVAGTNGDIVTAAGNIFAIDAAGQITENGTAIAITNSVTELAYVSGTLYQEATSQNLWWSFNEATNTWTETSDPLPSGTTGSGGGTAAPAAVAPILTVADPGGNTGQAIPLSITATQASASLAAADLTVTVSNLDGATLNHGTETAGVYTLRASDLSGLTVTPASGFTGTLALTVTATDTEATSSASSTPDTLDVTVNPVAAAPNLGVTNASGKEGSSIALAITAAQASASLAAADLTVTVSNLDGATLNHGTETAGVYTLHASDLSGLTVTPESGFTGTLALHVTATDTEASSSTSASSAMQTLDVSVTAPTPSANDTVVTGTNGHIVSAAGNTYAIDTAGQITENGVVMAITNSVTELAYVNGTVYQEATSQNLWWSYKETTNVWTETSNPLVHAIAPTLAVDQASGIENSAIALDIQATQATSALSTSDLSVTVSNLEGATLNHGTEANGVYTLNSSQLSGLTVAPAANFTGTLLLQVMATDTEIGSSASSATAMLDVSVSNPGAAEVLMEPSVTEGDHSIYLLTSLLTSNEYIASFNPATDLLDVAPLLQLLGYKGSNPIADHVLNLEPTSTGGTAVMIDPSGVSPTHGTTVVTLDHVLPQSLLAADIIP